MSLSSSRSDIDDAKFASIQRPAPQQQEQRGALYRSPEMMKDMIPSRIDLLLGGSFVSTPATVALWANHTH
jgi:hypothetical protein